MSETISTTPSNATDTGIGIDNLVNNNLTKALWAQLPAGRNFSDEASMCHILKKNDTLALFPGWEGIPTNIMANSMLFAVLMYGFYLLVSKVYKTERKTGTDYVANERSSDWIHFIYGKRASKQNIMFTTKEINREHPNAYLPLILHQHHNLIRGMLKTDPNTSIQQPVLFNRGVDDKSVTEANVDSKITTNTEKDSHSTVCMKTDTTEEDSEDEEQQMVKLKSILWDEDLSESLKVPSDDPESETPKKCFERQTKWFTKYLIIRDEDIRLKRGSDALQYLTFQRYILYFLIFTTFISLFIILPTNLWGRRLKDRPNTQFLQTTIVNIKPDSLLVYIHSLMTVLIVLVGIILMKIFSQFVGKKVENIDKKILLIENIPKLKRNSMEIRDYFRNRFPNVVIKRITFVYDIRKLATLMMRLWTSIEAKNYCIEYQRMYGQRCEVRPYCLGTFRGLCCCCLCYPKVNGLVFYSKEQKTLETAIDMELMITTATPQRIAFVVFETEEMASQVYYYFRQKYCYFYSISSILRRILGHETDSLNSWKWYVNYAPIPDDIDWKDIASKKWKVWALNIAINIVIVIMFLFISTPTSALNIIMFVARVKPKEKEEEKDENIPNQFYDNLWSYAPTLGYTILTAVLPQIIKILNTKIPFRTKSESYHSLMLKSYLFLVLMVLILPSLEIITVFSLFKNELHINNTGTAKEIQWSCLLPAENGAFFLNYVLTSTFIGNTLNMIRAPELSLYTFRFCLLSHNSAEYLSARQTTKFDFNFGSYYSRLLLHITLIITFSISCPLIAPAGLFYMIVKHLMDRYLIYHVFVPTRISQQIHSKAILCVYFALLLLLMQVYTHLAAMDNTIPSIIVGIVFILHFSYILIEILWDFLYFL